jgi:hypothetical protein
MTGSDAQNLHDLYPGNQRLSIGCRQMRREPRFTPRSCSGLWVA